MIQINENNIKQMRTLKIFINATAQIIEEEGIEKITIRKVAKITGYNSATIYNYFDNLNQLISFASMKFISDYIQALPDYMNQSNDTLERFLLMWECFCKYCFKKPKIYYAVFTANIGEQPEDLISSYYTLFPEELGKPPKELIPMLMEPDFSKRTRIAIEPCIQKEYFSKKEAIEISEMIRLLYQGMLSLLINNRVKYSAEEATRKTMHYIRSCVNKMADHSN